MRLSNKYGGLQFFAGPDNPCSLTFIFDSNVTQVTGLGYTWTTSGENKLFGIDDYGHEFYVTLQDGYTVDTVSGNITTGSVSYSSGDSFTIYPEEASGFGGTITITSKLGGASTMSKSYDLSTSSKWANLADGEHVIKLRAKGSGYGSSSFSNSVTVAKGAAGETWVLNETITFDEAFDYSTDFVSNSKDYTTISGLINGSSPAGNEVQIDYSKYGGSIDSVYQTAGGGWTDQKYRTLTFSVAPTSDLLAWLQANGTKQGVTEHTLTFSGDYESVTVDGESISSPYVLTKNTTIVVTCPASDIWNSGPHGDEYDDYQINVDGQPYYEETISVTNKDTTIEVSHIYPSDASKNLTRVLTINYTV